MSDAKKINHDLLTFKVNKGLAFYNKLHDKTYRDRAEYELGVIEKTGFSPYFLILSDLTAFMRRAEIMYMVRGSGCGSVCVWATFISNVRLDPVAMDLPFERFLNPARVSNPDIDVDIDDKRRHEVVAYTINKYGADRVARICNFGTLGAKAAIKDVARALDIINYQQVGTDIANLISAKPGTKLADEIAKSEALQEFQKRLPQLFDFALKAEGKVRQPGQHAAGVLIAPDNIWRFMPTFFKGSSEGREEGDSSPITQWDMYDSEERGLLKMDYLGLKTLGVIQTSCAVINQWHKMIGRAPFVLDEIKQDDQATWNLIGSGALSGIFQVEKQFVRNFARRMNLASQKSIWALAVLISIIRPGMMDSGMTEVYLKRTEGKELPTPPHPLLTKTLAKSYGCMVFQEDCMATCRDMAGMSMSDADTVRRGIGKKQMYILDKMKPVFIAGAVAKGATKEEAEHVWGLMEKFGRYGFNNAHAAAYALVGYWTAYLKTHFPVIYMACLMNSESGSSDKDMGYNYKVAEYAEEARRMKIAVSKPCIKRSMVESSVDLNRNEIIFGLGLIKRVSEGTARWLVERVAGARNLAEFAIGCYEVRPTGRKVMKVIAGVPTPTDRDEYSEYAKVNASEMEALIWSGVLDHYIKGEISLRPRLIQMLPKLMTMAGHYHHAQANIASGKRSMKDPNEIMVAMRSYLEEDHVPMGLEQLLDKEREFTGCFLSNSPFTPFMTSRVDYASMEELVERASDEYVIIGMVRDFREHVIKQGKNVGKKMCYATMVLIGGELEAVMFPEVYARVLNESWAFEKNKVYEFNVQPKEDGSGYIIQNVVRLSTWTPGQKPPTQ